jgi:hypothetical protein
MRAYGVAAHNSGLVLALSKAIRARPQTPEDPARRPGPESWTAVLVARKVRPGPRAVLTLLLLLAAGVALRTWLYGYGWSGVLSVTGAAIDRVRAGLSPWNVGYPKEE